MKIWKFYNKFNNHEKSFLYIFRNYTHSWYAAQRHSHDLCWVFGYKIDRRRMNYKNLMSQREKLNFLKNLQSTFLEMFKLRNQIYSWFFLYRGWLRHFYIIFPITPIWIIDLLYMQIFLLIIKKILKFFNIFWEI